MASYRVDDVRTVALVGHEVAGKTSLADALLYKAKAVDRRGSVDEGTSVSDFDEEEKKHKYSIDTTLLHLDYQGKRIYLIDTPGKSEFVGPDLRTTNVAVFAPHGTVFVRTIGSVVAPQQFVPSAANASTAVIVTTGGKFVGGGKFVPATEMRTGADAPIAPRSSVARATNS